MLIPPELSRVNRILFLVIMISIILYFGREFFIMISYSAFLAMLMTPVSSKLEEYRISRVFSSVISVLIIVAVISGVVFLLASQVSNISDDFPKIKIRLEELINASITWMNDKLGISSEKIIGTLKAQAAGAISNAGNILTGIAKGTFRFIGTFILVLVFTFLFLLQREKYENFIVMLYRPDRREEAGKIISKTSKIAQRYLSGRLISIFILTILYFLGFILIGLKNAILLSVIAALVTFIPYAGPVLGGMVPFFMAVIDGSFHQALGVVVVISLAQLFDNYFIEPYVVGGSVNISPFFAIFILIAGGVFWGISGVILFLPLLGVIKIIFENVEGLQPFAYLIGDQRDVSAPKQLWYRIKSLFTR
jgi:predicted PurR-regulated permease PerM